VLTLARAAGSFTAAMLDGTPATLTPPEAAGGAIQIFTREGRQIAGTRMAAAEVAALMTEANGFLPGATYRPDWLNGAGGSAYRGLTLDAALGAGMPALRLMPAPPALWSGAVEAPATPARSLTLEGAGALPVTLTLPEGGTARRLASLAAAAVPGMAARAETAVQITAPADGRLSFRLEGDNATPLAVSADVAGGRMDALLMAVNGLTGATGIAAELSPDGSRLILRHGQGADIRLTRLTHSAGAPVTLAQVDATGAPLSPDLTLGAGQDGVRFGGAVQLSQATGFSATLSGQRSDAVPDALTGGLVTRDTAAAGAVQGFDFRLDPALDAGGTAAAGPAAMAGGTVYSLTLGGRVAQVDAARTAARDGADIAAAMAASLRAGMPQAALTGGPLASLPPEGATTVVRVDGQDYRLRMEAGSLRVTGPEEGRLQAVFGPDNRLRLAVAGGVTDAATVMLPAGQAGAAAFGLGPAQGARATLLGQVPAALPATLSLSLGGVRHDLGVTAGPAIALPAGFPGTASVVDGAILLDVPATLGPLRVIAGEGSAAAGFATLGAALTVTGSRLTASATDGRRLETSVATSALAAQRLVLSDLPPEDLIVVMTDRLAGAGTLRIAGSVTAGPPPARPAEVELRVTDAAAGKVELMDRATGHSIGTRTLDATGGAVVGGLAVSMTGRAATGDRFTLTAQGDGTADGRAIDALLALRFRDAATGQGGFAQVLAGFQSDIGTRTAAAARRVSATEAILDTTRRADAAQGAVDLDTEAARLLELQQAYQASAQVMTVAKDLFDTLIRSL
jgi:flagellar hook-associated protein 1 FlgK